MGNFCNETWLDYDLLQRKTLDITNLKQGKYVLKCMHNTHTQDPKFGNVLDKGLEDS